MPTFIDHHSTMPEMTPEAADGIAKRIRGGEPDEFGVRGLNVYLAKSGGAYCISEAPSAEAVVKAHAAVGLAIGDEDVVEVESVV